MAASPSTVTMSVAEYLSTNFRPDVDYVDGHIEERNLGEWDHARLQAIRTRMLGDHEEEWGVYVVPQCRTQTGQTRFRIPDVCVTDANAPIEQVIQTPPLLCVEVVSPDDRLPHLFDRIKDYHRMGVETVWVFHPETKQVWVSSHEGVTEHTSGELSVPGTKIVLDAQLAFERAARRR